MIRIIGFLLIVGVAALGVIWFADRPGDVVVTWQGMRIETSLMVLGAAMLATMAVIAIIWKLVSLALRSPWILHRHLRHRRGVRAYDAISRGLIAIGAGDTRAAHHHAAEARKLAGAEPLTLLLSAQTAQLSGDRQAADRAFRAMAGRADTKTLGLRGLFIEAQRRDDHMSAHAYAEEAARHHPGLGWAGKAVLEARCRAGDWTGALALLETNKDTLDKQTYRRRRAVLLTARATVLKDSDRDTAKACALEAVKLAPTLVPAAALAGRMVAEGGEVRKASRIIEKAWRALPHPDLARVAADLRFGDAARDRLKRIEAFAKLVPGHIESALAVARAAIDAQEFTKARTALSEFLSAPTKRVALMMAELERAEHNDEGRAREWIARAVNAAPDPAWTAEGHVSNNWRPASPAGVLDAFEWRVPLASIAGISAAAAPVIEAPAPNLDAPASLPPSDDRNQSIIVAVGPEVTVEPRLTAEPKLAAEQKPAAAAAPRSNGEPPKVELPQGTLPKAEPIIPLMHAPDDPGPDGEDEDDSEPAPQVASWRKMFE
jgi:HemY protein